MNDILDVRYLVPLVVLALGAALAGVLLDHLTGRNQAIEDLVPTAPARVVAYLDTLGVTPQGAVICRPEYGIFLVVGIQCEAMVGSVLTVFACNAQTCWAR
jgi:hypothetical protein